MAVETHGAVCVVVVELPPTRHDVEVEPEHRCGQDAPAHDHLGRKERGIGARPLFLRRQQVAVDPQAQQRERDCGGAVHDPVGERYEADLAAVAFLPLGVEPEAEAKNGRRRIEDVGPRHLCRQAHEPVENAEQHCKARIVAHELEGAGQHRDALRTRWVERLLGRRAGRGIGIGAERQPFDLASKPGEAVAFAVHVDRRRQRMRGCRNAPPPPEVMNCVTPSSPAYRL